MTLATYTRSYPCIYSFACVPISRCLVTTPHHRTAPHKHHSLLLLAGCPNLEQNIPQSSTIWTRQEEKVREHLTGRRILYTSTPTYFGKLCLSPHWTYQIITINIYIYTYVYDDSVTGRARKSGDGNDNVMMMVTRPATWNVV